jgi:hypothetical protein
VVSKVVDEAAADYVAVVVNVRPKPPLDSVCRSGLVSLAASMSTLL